MNIPNTHAVKQWHGAWDIRLKSFVSIIIIVARVVCVCVYQSISWHLLLFTQL